MVNQLDPMTNLATDWFDQGRTVSRLLHGLAQIVDNQGKMDQVKAYLDRHQVLKRHRDTTKYILKASDFTRKALIDSLASLPFGSLSEAETGALLHKLLQTIGEQLEKITR